MKNKSANFVSRNYRNTLNLAFWTFSWLITLALASFGPKLIWMDNDLLTIFAIILNVAFGVGMILANRRFINGLDELQKKIQLESLALAVGVAVVGGLSYSLLDVTNMITGDAEISVVCVLISITYIGGIIIGQNRYS